MLLGKKAQEIWGFFSFLPFPFLCLAALSLPFCPFEPDLWLQFNSCNNTAYYGHDIIHSTRIAVFLSLSLSLFFQNKAGKFYLDRGLVCTDLQPETQPAHLLDFHNRHYCTPQEFDPTHAAYKVWMAGLYGILVQLCVEIKRAQY